MFKFFCLRYWPSHEKIEKLSGWPSFPPVSDNLRPFSIGGEAWQKHLIFRFSMCRLLCYQVDCAAGCCVQGRMSPRSATIYKERVCWCWFQVLFHILFYIYFVIVSFSIIYLTLRVGVSNAENFNPKPRILP